METTPKNYGRNNIQKMTKTTKYCQLDRCAATTSKNSMMISQNYIDHHHLSKLSSSLATFSIGLENQLEKITETVLMLRYNWIHYQKLLQPSSVKSKKTIHENAKQHHYIQAKQFLENKKEHLRKLEDTVIDITTTIMDMNNIASTDKITINDAVQLPLSDIVTRCQLLLKENENRIANVQKIHGSKDQNIQQRTKGDTAHNNSIFEYTYEHHKVSNDMLHPRSNILNMMNHYKSNISASTDTSLNTINPNMITQTPILQSVMEVEEETDETKNGTTNTDCTMQKNSFSNNSISKSFDVDRLHDTPRGETYENRNKEQIDYSWNTTETYSTSSSLPLPGGTVKKARFKKIKASPVKLFHNLSDSSDVQLFESEKIPLKISFVASTQNISQSSGEIDTATIPKDSQDTYDGCKNVTILTNDNDTNESLPGDTVRKKPKNNDIESKDITSSLEHVIDATKSEELSQKNEQKNKSYSCESELCSESAPMQHTTKYANCGSRSNNTLEILSDTNSYVKEDNCSLRDYEKENVSIAINQMITSIDERQKCSQVNELDRQTKTNMHHSPPKKDHHDGLNVMTKEFFGTPSSKMSLKTSLLVTPDQRKLYRKQVFIEDMNGFKNEIMKANGHAQYMSNSSSAKPQRLVAELQNVQRKVVQKLEQSHFPINTNYNNELVSTTPKNAFGSIKTCASHSYRLTLSEKVRNLLGPTSPLDRIPLTSAWVSKSLNNISCPELTVEWGREKISSGLNQSADHNPYKKIYEIIIGDVSKEEYASAPMVIQMQLSHKEINEGLNLINKHLHVKKELCNNEMEMILSEKMAFQVLGTLFGNKKSKGILMSLCYFEKISMRVMGHEKSFVVSL